MRCNRMVVLLGILGVAYPVSLARADCGQLVTSACPGCSTSGNPADTTCYCGDVSGSCLCRKTSGGAQGGSLTTCYTDTWSYVADPNGYVMVEAASQLCMEVEWCRSAAGGGACGSAPCSSTCSWTVTEEGDLSFRMPFDIGAKCVNGIPQ